MFEEITREVKKLQGMHEFTLSLPEDEKGFWDRRCPNEACGAFFKVLSSDWRSRVKPEGAFCPFCRHEAPADQWHTPEQVEHIQSAARAEMTRLFQEALRRGVQRSRPVHYRAGPFGMTMSVSCTLGRIPPIIPVEAADVLRQEFCCEVCSCRYASLGASFFCPACGHNSASSAFGTTLTTIRKAVNAMGPWRSAIEQSTDADTAQNAVRQILEDQFPRLVGAFECLNEALFDQLPNAAAHSRKGAVFQRIDDASLLWQQATCKGYGDFLSAHELGRLKLLFQRRHVLSHCQGIVDQAYISRSGDNTYSLGQRLVVHDSDVLELVDLLDKLAHGLNGIVPPRHQP